MLRCFSALKKKHSKTGEESRYQGTVIGIPADGATVQIEGGDVESIQAWSARMHRRSQIGDGSTSERKCSAIATTESSPLSDI